MKRGRIDTFLAFFETRGGIVNLVKKLSVYLMSHHDIKYYIYDIIKIYFIIIDFQNSESQINTFYCPGTGEVHAFTNSTGTIRSGIGRKISDCDLMAFF